ncbi:MAG TPA: metallophosphoesterase [Phycisphaerales bacterium]|nr:metallophosphoesterase [Phycisphaerales bacterium]
MNICKTIPAALFLALLAAAPVHDPHAHSLARPSARISAGAGPDSITCAVIGDYGDNSPAEASVAALVNNTIRPQFILTTGGNNALSHSFADYDLVVGQFYHQYLFPYIGIYGAGAASENNFFPAPGNQDWDGDNLAGFLNFFSLPGNERYYDFIRGPVRFFVVDSDPREPDETNYPSAQAFWLRKGLESSTSAFNIVIFHHPAFSSGTVNGPSSWMQWPFKLWGADAVISGDDHVYERLDFGGIPFFVVGASGQPLDSFATPLPQSILRYSADFGAMKISADASHLTFDVYSLAAGGSIIDSLTITPDQPQPDLIPPNRYWEFWDQGYYPGDGWNAPGYVEIKTWSASSTQIGYGDGDEITTAFYGPDPDNKYITTWFRREISIPDPSIYSSLRLAILCDDGAIAYINGIEVFRTNMPSGPVSINTLASSDVSGAQEATLYETLVNPCLLRAGANVVAAEVHQSSPSSPDLSFELVLSPSPLPPPPCLGACPADIAPPGGDHLVNIDDLTSVILAWNTTNNFALDINDDGIINIDDLTAIILSWGACN